MQSCLLSKKLESYIGIFTSNVLSHGGVIAIFPSELEEVMMIDNRQKLIKEDNG